MEAQIPTSSPSRSSLRRVLESRLYRGATAAMFLSGLGVSAAMPQVVLFLVKEFGVPLPTAGLFFLTSLAAPVGAYIVGSYSDRSGRRLGLFRLCALAGALGWAGIAVSTAAWVPFMISALALAFSQGAGSQLFAAIHDDLAEQPGDGNEGVVAIVRMAMTAGWVVGPVAGTWIASQLGLRALFSVTAACFILQIVPLGTLRMATPQGGDTQVPAAGQHAVRRWQRMLPLLVFTGLYILAYAGEPIKYGFLLLYMEEKLKLSAGVRGAVIGIQPLVEIFIMPFSVVLARKTGILWLMCAAAALGVAANICFATWDSAVGMFAGQVLMGGVWGAFAALGIIAAQRLLPEGVATASGIFMSSSPLGNAVGGMSASVGISYVGLPHVFFLPALLSAVAVVGLGAMARRNMLG